MCMHSHAVWLKVDFLSESLSTAIYKQIRLDIICESSVMSERLTGYIGCSLKGGKMRVSVGIEPGTYQLQS